MSRLLNSVPSSNYVTITLSAWKKPENKTEVFKLLELSVVKISLPNREASNKPFICYRMKQTETKYCLPSCCRNLTKFDVYEKTFLEAVLSLSGKYLYIPFLLNMTVEKNGLALLPAASLYCCF